MDLDGLVDGHRPENELIPSVAPADLRKVWAVQRNIRSHFPGQQILLGDDTWERACSPGADLFAMFYRIAFLEMLAKPTEPLSPWLHGGELDDAVFKVFATFPMKRINKGGQDTFPFNIRELTKQIEKEATLADSS